MPEIKQRKFLRKTIKLGNSCGVLLPKYLLGADVRVLVVNPPIIPSKDLPKILESMLHEIFGIYITQKTEKNIDVLVVSTTIREKITKGHYKIDIVPLNILKKLLKEHKEIKEKIKKAEVVINKQLLNELIKLA
jgi:hypothetical protein